MSDNYIHPHGSTPAYGTAPPLTPSMGPLPQAVFDGQPPYDPSKQPPPCHGPPEYPASNTPSPHAQPAQASQNAPYTDSSSHAYVPTCVLCQNGT